eukprot:366440-Chlamydomonas_euryale.AAC.4
MSNRGRGGAPAPATVCPAARSEYEPDRMRRTAASAQRKHPPPFPPASGQAVCRGGAQLEDCVHLGGAMHRMRHLRQGGLVCSSGLGWVCSSGLGGCAAAAAFRWRRPVARACGVGVATDKHPGVSTHPASEHVCGVGVGRAPVARLQACPSSL